jgi:hypothetical protein
VGSCVDISSILLALLIEVEVEVEVDKQAETDLKAVFFILRHSLVSTRHNLNMALLLGAGFVHGL